MKVCNFLGDYLKDDIIGQIYRNDLNFAEHVLEIKEYKKIMQHMKKQEKKLVHVNGFKEYLENRNIKDAIEAEEQFKLGFKMAVKLLIESYHS